MSISDPRGFLSLTQKVERPRGATIEVIVDADEIVAVTTRLGLNRAKEIEVAAGARLITKHMGEVDVDEPIDEVMTRLTELSRIGYALAGNGQPDTSSTVEPL